ncbi:MAG: tetratricopeptide repeat protein [Bacteroidales bacterium]
MRKIGIIIGLLLIANGTGLIAQSARSYFKAGEEFYISMNYEDAIDQFTKAIGLDPEYEDAYIYRARAYSQTGDHANAAKDFDRALAFNEKDDELYYLSAKEWHLVGNSRVSLAKLDQAISRKRNFLEAYQLRAEVHMDLKQYDQALQDYQSCLRLSKDEEGYYHLGTAYEKMGMLKEAEEAYLQSIDENNRIPETYFALAGVQYERKRYEEALGSVRQMLALEPGNLEGIILQSKLQAALGNYPKAIETLSTASVESPMEPDIYLHRGDIYRMTNQLSNAIIDYTRAIDLSPGNAELYYKRGRAYEEIKQVDKALEDYDRLLEMSSDDETAQALYEEASRHMFDLSREENKPRVVLEDPLPGEGNRISVPNEVQVIDVAGLIEDESKIKSLQVNGNPVPVEHTAQGRTFFTSVNLMNADIITIQVTDAYNNSETAIYPIRRTEVTPPNVQMIAPYSADGNTLYLDGNESRIYLEGRIEDESKIRSIYVDSVMASYIPDDLNPYFSALVNIDNRSSITVRVVDEFGNESASVFTLNRDVRTYENNPMGKTWVVFIENSDYDHFTSLEGPSMDVGMMQAALNKYQIDNLVHKQNMTKEEMQRFFSIELRDMIRSNKINSLLIWYAGHGKFINGTGYWLPVDADGNDEFSYYNIGQLKASMESYPDFLTHKLVITDACESGPSFYRAMRGEIRDRSCEDWASTQLKSSQVFSSAGNESASDKSQFTKTFANMLASNPGECISIEQIVQRVTASMLNNNQQRPQFGKIAGLEDEDGTFFFIPKGFE